LNSKNVQRLLLTSDEKATIKPLLALVIARMDKQMTPESMLVQAIVALLVNKFKTGLEIRSEIAVHTQMIKDEIRSYKEELRTQRKYEQAKEAVQSQAENPLAEEADPVKHQDQSSAPIPSSGSHDDIIEPEFIEVEEIDSPFDSPFPPSALEVAED